MTGGPLSHRLYTSHGHACCNQARPPAFVLHLLKLPRYQSQSAVCEAGKLSSVARKQGDAVLTHLPTEESNPGVEEVAHYAVPSNHNLGASQAAHGLPAGSREQCCEVSETSAALSKEGSYVKGAHLQLY